MAKNYKHTKNTTETIKINGNISEDGKSITYVEKDGDVTIPILDITKKFALADVTICISETQKIDQDE